MHDARVASNPEATSHIKSGVPGTSVQSLGLGDIRVGAEQRRILAFDRGGPVWPPRSNAKDGRSGEGLSVFAPPAKNG